MTRVSDRAAVVTTAIKQMIATLPRGTRSSIICVTNLSITSVKL
ncbi:MAG: hypothetical protein WBG18_20585 [Xanthobacteraceae bacterium]